MKPQDIKAALIKNKEKQIDIARELRVQPSSVNMVIDGKFVSRRIRQAIADRAGISFEKMWGKAA
jgi:lambda repressor-like predicted transcriptional regulator